MFRIEPPLPYHSFKTYVGFDPGTVHMGIAVTCSSDIYLYQVEMIRMKDTIRRILAVQHLLDILYGSLGVCDPYMSAVIEGSAFSEHFRQTELAECRTGIALWLIGKRHKESDVNIVNPLTIRKVVFGSAKLKAHDYWDNSEIPNDALAALSCLYYADELEKDTEK